MARRVPRTPVLPSGLPRLDPALGPLNRTLFQTFTEHSNRLNAGMQRDGSEPAQAPVPLQEVALADLPPAADWPGGIIFVTDGGLGGAGALYVSDGTSWDVLTDAGNTALQIAANLSDVDDAATSFDNIKQPATDSYSGVVELATAAEIAAMSDLVRAVTLDQILDAQTPTTTTYAATFNWSWTDKVNHLVTLTGTFGIVAPTNMVPGTYRTIWVVGDSGTPRTVTFSSGGGNFLGGTTASITDVTNGKAYLITFYAVTANYAAVGYVQG